MEEKNSINQATIIGSGVIGRSWAIVIFIFMN